MEKTKLFIYGAGGHGKVVRDVAKRVGFDEIVFIDDKKGLGFGEFVKNYKNETVFVAIGDNKIREEKLSLLEELNYNIATLIDPSAVIGEGVEIQKGVVVMPNAVINASSIIKKGVILNTSCVVEHDCVIGEFSHIAPNAAMGGGVRIGKNSFIGIGSSLRNGITIGDNVVIGMGSVVVNDIKSDVTAYGNPATIRSIR